MKHETSLAGIGRAICALATFALIAGTPAVFAQAHTMDKKDRPMPGMAAGGDMQSHMRSMMKNMDSMKMTGNTDVDFAATMKMHHQGAIDMAQAELQNGKDVKMRSLAKQIIKDQQKEIKEFDKWLAKHK